MLNENHQILLIDDDRDILDAYSHMLHQEGYHVWLCQDPRQAPSLIPSNWAGVILCDVCMPLLSGMELLDILLKQDRHQPVILITGHGDVPTAVEAVKKGAFDYLEKPIAPTLLLKRVENALTIRNTLIARRRWQHNLLNEHLIGHSQWLAQLRINLQKLSEIDVPIFFSGEMGTGRSLAARYIHKISANNEAPFVLYELTEHSDFSLENGFQEANGGTLVIKNIELLNTQQQNRLVHFMNSDTCSVRLIAISLFPPAQLAADHKIIPELYYHFSLTHYDFLPLSKRPGDIEPLFQYYLQRACNRLNRPLPKANDAFLRTLSQRVWGGNVHELVSAAELYAVGIMPSDKLIPSPLNHPEEPALDSRVEQFERALIIEALNLHQGKINEVADYLQIPRKKLYLRMKKYQINKSEFR